MSHQKTLVAITLLISMLFAPTLSTAGDFDWLKELNLTAINDPAGFKAKLAARFQIGDAQISTVISNVTQPADAYMVLRLGEISGRPTDEVIKTYQGDKSKGWGVMAKSLGIKPGSKAFHALKRGDDLQHEQEGKEQAKGSNHGSSHGNGNGNGNGNGKNKGKD